MKAKQIKLKAACFDGECNLGPGWAIVIGREPKDRPYLNIEDDEGRLLVSIDRSEMDRIVKAWVKARGGYPA